MCLDIQSEIIIWSFKKRSLSKAMNENENGVIFEEHSDDDSIKVEEWRADVHGQLLDLVPPTDPTHSCISVLFS